MGKALSDLSQYWGFAVIIICMLVGRALSNSALRRLDDPHRLLLVEAQSRSTGWLVAYAAAIAFALYFAPAGFFVFLVLLGVSLAYNQYWFRLKGFPAWYRLRIGVSGALQLVGIAALSVSLMRWHEP